jgi:hypothetical protein
MRARPARCVVPIVAAGLMQAAVADEAAEACPEQQAGLRPFFERDASLRYYQELPMHCLRAVFMRCSAQAGEGLLDLGNAVACSDGYEALLKREFNGDFRALLAWWRQMKRVDKAND